MATPTEITYRKAGVEYHEERLSEMGGWNADATDATLGRDEFSEVRNFRRPTTGDFEVRTGCTLNPIAYTQNAELLAKCEYRNDYKPGTAAAVDTFFDVSLYYKSGEGFSLQLLTAELFNVVTTAPILVIADPGATAEAWVVQYAWSLIVTIKGHGTYEVSPTDNTLATWTVRALGKDLCPTPVALRFVGKTEGDLFVIDNSGSGGVSTFASYIKYDPNDPGQPLLIPLTVAADYWIVDSSAAANGTYHINDEAFAINDPARWVWNSTDVVADSTTLPKDSARNSRAHNITRAWGYRFVAVQEFTNSKGEKYRVRSAPSVDLWIPDMIYAPAQWGPEPLGSNVDNNVGGGDATAFLFINGFVIIDTSNAPHAVWYPIHGIRPASDHVASSPLPTEAEVQALQTKVQKRIDPVVSGTDGNIRHSFSGLTDPYFWLAEYLGMVKANNNARWGGKAPYLTEVPASKLKQAPMTVFDWVDFSITSLFAGLQGTVTEIEIYRTAHSEPNEKDDVTKSPNFETHRYGYVGSVVKDGTFTDDVIDDAIDFGTTPELQDGYLRGEFSGSIMREFDNRLVIGDVITDYVVLSPAQAGGDGSITNPGTVQGFWYNVTDKSPSTNYVQADWKSAAGAPIDDNWKTSFYAAYVDSDGNHSDATRIPMVRSATVQNGSATKIWASFVFPRGYAANVTQVKLYRGVWNPALTPPAREYTLLTTLAVEHGDATYVSQNEAGTAASAGDLTGNTKRSTSPGSIIFSQPNQIYFWPPLNFENHHLYAPVRMLEVVLGPLYVGTDMSVSLTELNGKREELTRSIGPITRHAVQKVDKIVFFLSPYGMYYIESSGVVEFPAQVKTAVLPYLNEEILGVERLTNARRASLGFLGERGELWLHLPSSKDLQGSLPHRTIIYKLGTSNDPRRTVNYEFDLTEEFERGDMPASVTHVGIDDDTTRWRPEHVIFQTRAMGGLFAGYYRGDSNAIITVDNDVPPAIWSGSEVLEKSWHLGTPGVKKALRGLTFRTQGFAQMKLSTGQPAPNDTVTHLQGRVNPASRVFLVNDPLSPVRHIIAGQTLESVASCPITRIWGEPDAYGRNNLHVKSIDIFAVILNNHP